MTSEHPYGAMPSDRLFHCLPTPTERAERRGRWRSAQSMMFVMDGLPEIEHERTCPACSGVGPGCTCDRTGAQALGLPYADACIDDRGGGYFVRCPVCHAEIYGCDESQRTTEDAVTKGAAMRYAEHYEENHR